MRKCSLFNQTPQKKASSEENNNCECSLYLPSATEFDKKCVKLAKFLKTLAILSANVLFSKCLNLHWQILYAIEQIFVAANERIFKNNN